MGKMIEQLAKERGHNIVGILEVGDTFDKVKSKNIDVAIEFTTPQSAFNNIKICIQNNIPIVVGTTGWYDKFNEIKRLVNEHSGSLMYATNFAIGVYLFRQLNIFLAKQMKDFTFYSPSITEIL